MQKDLIGVIVPVYNVEKYIVECIESILAQTYTNFRLILVDDGTPDNAGKICDEYAKKDSRITVIHQENAGVTRARARGVEEANNCEWITFVDSDDIITTSFLEELHNSMDEAVDIIVNNSKEPSGHLSIDKYLGYLFGENSSIQLAPWNKMFRASLFSPKIFDIPRCIVVGEDMLMNIRLTFSSNKQYIAVINKPNLYTYRDNEVGITRTFKSSPEYEHFFQQSVKRSIPEREYEKYYVFTIKNRLLYFFRFWGYKYCVKEMKFSAFYHELKEDIRIHKYELSTIDRIIFNSQSPIIRFLAINIKKISNYLNKNKK